MKTHNLKLESMLKQFEREFKTLKDKCLNKKISNKQFFDKLKVTYDKYTNWVYGAYMLDFCGYGSYWHYTRLLNNFNTFYVKEMLNTLYGDNVPAFGSIY